MSDVAAFPSRALKTLIRKSQKAQLARLKNSVEGCKSSEADIVKDDCCGVKCSFSTLVAASRRLWKLKS